MSNGSARPPGNRASISVADVDNIQSMGAALQVITALQIPVKEKCLSLEKAKLIVKDFIQGGSHRPKRPAPWADRDSTTAALKDDFSNRKALRELFSKSVAYIGQLPKPFQNDLEQMFPQFERHLKNHTEDLQSSQCVLLVAGEMGSGKSSLVNLLLGVPILPTSELRCTAAIVEITYGQVPQAIAHFRDDSSGRSKRPVQLRCDNPDSPGKFLKELKHYITVRDDETDESPYEKIQVFWPLDMLQGGVTIVDSPGIGDSRGLPHQLADYMERAFGFVYVIDSTSSIHKHRLGQILLKAVETSDGFDHNTTLFVCNRWDHIPADASERVKESLADRLSMIVPGVKKSQLHPISVKQSLMDVEYGQVRQEHQQLIEGIRRFLPQAMRGKLRVYYRYLSNVLKRSLYSLRISYNMHKEKVEEIKQNYSTVESRIGILQKNAKEKLDTMRQEVKMMSIKAATETLGFLDSMHQRVRLTKWYDKDCPTRDKAWLNVQKNANFAIAERVATEVNNWEREVSFVQTMQDKIINRFKDQFELFDDQLSEIRGALLNGDEMRSYIMDASRDMPQRKQMKPPKSGKGGVDGYLSLGSAVTSAFTLDPKDPKVKKIFKDYDCNPCAAMKEATEIYLSLMSETAIAVAMGKFFDRFVKGIDRVGSMVPQLMRADQCLLQTLTKELETGRQKLNHFPTWSKTCSDIQGNLDMFFVQRLMVTDFTADQLMYGEKLGHGSFATVYKATLKLKTGDVPVAIKEPLNKLMPEDVTDVLLEDSMLKELENINIVKYFGVCRKGPDNNMRLIFTMEYCPYTLKAKCIDIDNSPSSLGNNLTRQREAISIMTNYLVQICNGLSYLHTKSVVHRDLKPENVLLTARGEVRIADFGLAKKVRDIVTVGIGTPVYMSPEILLLTDKYDTKADIYSLAMIMWELWFGKDLAKYAALEVQGGLKTSIESGWRPSLTIVHSPCPFWVEMMTSSWDKDPKKRPTAKEIGKKLVMYLRELRGTHS